MQTYLKQFARTLQVKYHSNDISVLYFIYNSTCIGLSAIQFSCNFHLYGLNQITMVVNATWWIVIWQCPWLFQIQVRILCMHEIVQKSSTDLSKHFTVVLTKAASLKLDVKMNFLVKRILNKSVFFADCHSLIPPRKAWHLAGIFEACSCGLHT